MVDVICGNCDRQVKWINRRNNQQKRQTLDANNRKITYKLHQTRKYFVRLLTEQLIRSKYFKQMKLKPKNNNAKNYQKIEEMRRNITNRTYLMEKINHYIYEIADRNGAMDANYAYFLILLYLTIGQIVINIYPSQDLLSSQKFIFGKLQSSIIKKQLNQNLYYEFMTIVLRKQKLTVKVIHSLMKKIMTGQRQICIAIFPYYFNLFAMVLNKQVIFNDQPEQNLIPYSFQITMDTRYKGSFSRQDVFRQLRRVQKLTIQRYHSPQL